MGLINQKLCVHVFLKDQFHCSSQLGPLKLLHWERAAILPRLPAILLRLPRVYLVYKINAIIQEILNC